MWFLLLATLVLALIYGIVVFIACLFTPFEYIDFDINKNGLIGVFELDYALSYSERTIETNGVKCKEYFALKDGLSIKLVCENQGFTS